MVRLFRRLVQQLQCRREMHNPVLCEVAVFNDATQQHTHTCQSCGQRTKDETLPLDPRVTELLSALGLPLSALGLDPGLAVEDQREAFIH